MKGFSVFAAFVGTVMMIIALIIGLTFIQNHITLNRMAVGIKSDTEFYDAVQETRALLYSSMNYYMLKGIKKEIEQKKPLYFCESRKECLKRAESFVNDIKNYAQTTAVTKALDDIKNLLLGRGISIVSLTTSLTSMPPKLVWNESGTYIVFNSSNTTARFQYRGRSSTVVISSPMNYTIKLPWDFVHIINTTANTTGSLLEKIEKKQAYVIASCFCNCSCECDPHGNCWCKRCKPESRGVEANIITIWNGNHRILHSEPGNHSSTDDLGCRALLDITNKDNARKDLAELLSELLDQNLSKYDTDYKLSLNVIDYNITMLPSGGDAVKIRAEMPGVYSPITDSVCREYVRPRRHCSYTIKRKFIVTNISVNLNLTAKAECSASGEPELNITIGFTNK